MITWTDVIRVLSPGFKKEWTSLVKDEKLSLCVVSEEDAQDMIYTTVLQSLDDEKQGLQQLRHPWTVTELLIIDLLVDIFCLVLE